MLDQIRPHGLGRERAGVIVPTGVATDATTAPFFAALVEQRRLARLVDFENRAGLFPAVDSRMKFSLLTLGRNEGAAHFAFFLTDPAQLAEAERNFTLSPEAIARLNPNTKTAPVLRSRADSELTARIYARMPVLMDESKGAAGDPWKLEFRQGLFNMTSDSSYFRTAEQLAANGFDRDGMCWESARSRYVPLYEAKMISFFDHRAAGYGQRGEDRGYRVLPETSLDEHSDPAFEVEPYYWVPLSEIKGRLSPRAAEGWLVGWKDVTSPTNERTSIFTVIPRVGVGHTLPLLFSEIDASKQAALCANLDALVADYCARNSVAGLHLTYGYLKQFPIFSPEFYNRSRLTFITQRVLKLIYTSYALAPFARDLGYDGPPFPWNENRRALLRADLDAFYARAYGLDRDELRYILDPADVKGPDYPSETFRVLKKNEEARYCEYRTRRLVLEAWDRMEASGEFKALGM
jgi:hypothetical protein